MERSDFDDKENSDDSLWIPNNIAVPSSSSQHILLDGSESNFSHSIHGKDVVVVASQASGTNQDGVGSSMVKFKPIVNYDWESKYEYGNLVVCHPSKVYFAYVLRSCTQGKTTGIVRVTNRKTIQRTLLKNFVGKVADISFAASERVILGIVDSVGNLFVYEFFEENDQTLGQKLLLNCMRPDNSLMGSIHRLIWCSYIGEDDKSGSEATATGEPEGQLDDSMMLLLTHNEIAELWHVDLVMRTSSSVQVSTSLIECGLHVIQNHSKAITDAAFSPDATAVATASLDGDIKFFQVDLNDSNPPKCIHYWQPHEGRPISFLHFLDDHKNKNPQAHLWKFAVTGCNENQELKIWDCQNWSCLQTVSFTPSVGSLLNVEDETMRDFVDDTSDQDIQSSIKAKFDLSSSFLVLSDIKRRALYVLEVSVVPNDARISSINEFLLINPCLSFDVVDACLQKGGMPSSIGDNGFQLDQDWPLSAGNLDDDQEGQRSPGTSASVKLFTVHSRALQELTLKFVPVTTGDEIIRRVINAAPEFSSTVGSIRDLLADMSDDLPLQKVNSLLPTSHFSSMTALSAPVHSARAGASPAGNQSGVGFQTERRSSSLSSSTLSHTPLLLAPDAFVSPRDAGRAALSSSVDFGGDEDEEEDEDDEVEVRGDVEGADRDRPDGGSRARTTTGGGAASHLFDRGGDGGGDGDSSGASTASQEVTEILEGVEDAIGAMDAPVDQGKNSDDVDADEDDKFSGTHLRAIDPQPPQLPQPPLIHPSQQHLPYVQQQHNIAHHIPNLQQMSLPSIHHQVPSSSTTKVPILGHQHHQSLVSSAQSPRPLHQPFVNQRSTPSHRSPLNTKWPQAAGIINVDDLVRKSEALEQSSKERRSHDGSTLMPFLEADELERRFFNANESGVTSQAMVSATLQDLLELARVQSQEMKMMAIKLQQQAQIEANLRGVVHQIESLSKEVKSLATSIDRLKPSTHDRVESEKFLERCALKCEGKTLESVQACVEKMVGTLSGQLEKAVSEEIKKSILPKFEQSLDNLKEKLSNELGHKMSSADNTIRNTISKVFKSKPVVDSISQSVSVELRGTLRSANQDIIVPSFERGCNNVVHQVNAAFQAGTQQYVKSLEMHLNQTRKAIENQKHPVVQQIKSVSDALAQSEAQQKQTHSQLLSVAQLLQSQIRNTSVNSQGINVEENKLQSMLNRHLESVVDRVKDVMSEKLACLLRDHEVAIKDQFDAALRSATPAPSTSSLSDHHQQLRVQISALLHLAKYNSAFQQALSASDLNLVEFTCDNVDTSEVFGDHCFLSQSVLLSLIQQLAADLSTKTELKYRFLDEAIVSLDPSDPVTKEHLTNVVEQLCTNLSNFLAHNAGGPLHRDLSKLLKRANVLLRTHSRNKY